MCQKCGCNTCETDSTALMLNESKAPRTILSEGLKHHIDANKPLTDNFYTAGSRDYFDLIAEARSLYSRGILDFTNKRDIELLTETDQGHFGVYEGKKGPLDFPIELNEEEQLKENREEEALLMQIRDLLQQMLKGDSEREEDIEDLDVSIDAALSAMSGKSPLAIDVDQEVFGRLANVKEAKKKKEKKDPPIGKPKRGGSKAYYVYVRDPKTKKVKKVSFGSGGLRAKIRNPKARKAFAARHNCKNKKDRTTAGYWSCNLPRYAPALGLGAKMNTYW